MRECRELLLTRADECEQLAAAARSEYVRQRFLALARYWLVLAGEMADAQSPGCAPVWSQRAQGHGCGVMHSTGDAA